MASILLINPSYEPSYGGSRASIVNPIMPTLGLATIAAVAIERGHKVEILDLSWRPYNPAMVFERLKKTKPDIVGLTGTTPLMNQVRDISVIVKDVSKDILLIAGGAHPSALPEETLRESLIDIICVGEADYSFSDLCDGAHPSAVNGIYYRDGENVLSTDLRLPINNLDDLPLPAWELYNPEDYRKISRLLCKAPPLTMAEFSRGCVFTCDFCASKITLAKGYRKKSPKRCAEEVTKMKTLGFNEFMLADDIFTSNQNWAVEVCEEILKKDLKMAWSCTNGIRVESADDNLFNAMHKAGCYRVSFGFESGNDKVLEMFGKGGRANIEQGKSAVIKARKAGLDTSGFFLLGLSPDTEDTMKDTINYARALPLDMIKFGITIAFPGTKMFNDYVRNHLIRSYNWDDYFIYTDEPLFAHKNLTYKTIKKYTELAYRRAILTNPGFILRRIIRGIRTNEFFWDVFYGIKFFFMPSVTEKVDSNYHSADRWPQHDFETFPPKPAKYQTVRKQKTTVKAA
ncbi:MAG: radical SAM protein [Magnetovibrio sp.]|nr:radical SAM protein [Magnetovibrio sp.]